MKGLGYNLESNLGGVSYILEDKKVHLPMQLHVSDGKLQCRSMKFFWKVTENLSN